MNVGIIGSGDVAQALGRGLVQHAHAVMLGSRTPAKIDAWTKETGGKAGALPQAAAFGEILSLATRGEATEAAIDLTVR